VEAFFCLVPPCGIVSLEFMLSEAEVSKEKERRKIEDAFLSVD
jgi:hypothetical protein